MQELKRVNFVIPKPPKGKERPRLTKRGQAYTPKPTKEYEKVVKESYLQVTDHVFEGAIKVTINAYHVIPQKDSKTLRAGKLDGLIKATVKPDIDNVAKIILDGLNKVAYNDDNQVIQLYVNKQYGEVGKVVVTIEEVL
jgi:Holliday junction resolvase RusA-like endonuclease